MSETRLPTISLVTPSLNQGRFLRATIESVLGQELPDLDYFVQDGGSADGALDILRSYGGRVAFVSEKDRGQADAINRGLRRARGEILGYLNSDDVLRPGALRAVAETFASRPEILFVWGRAAYVDDEGRSVHPFLVDPDALRRLVESCFIAQPAAFFRRRVWEEVGEFDETLHHTMDYDYWLRIASRFGPSCGLFLDRELAGARLHKSAKSVAGWDRALDEIFDLVKRRAGYVSLWWCVAKWDYRLDGRSQATEPHPIPWRAGPPACLEFLRQNPPGLWPRGLRDGWRGLRKRLGVR
ncbi:MAG TPA: glycosyltransferase family 2 protein [Thermoanaerobaculia bacterium]|nr:glycosyltransferase family 2 protein [Thermoanaerobaculia bacterium]